MAFGGEAVRSGNPSSQFPTVACRNGTGSPALSLRKQLVINNNVSPGSWMDTKRRPFDMTGQTARRRAPTYEITPVTKPAAVKIAVGICSVRRYIAFGMSMCRAGNLI